MKLIILPTPKPLAQKEKLKQERKIWYVDESRVFVSEEKMKSLSEK